MSEIKTDMQPKQPVKDVQLGSNIFSGWMEFQAASKMAAALSTSTIVPKDYQNNGGNCLIAIEMANRMGTSPMMVMQNLYVVNGRPAWSSQYIVATINSSRKYKTELQYEMEYDSNGKILACTAFVFDNNNHKVVGPKITMEMADKEGWINKNGSKWKTMPEVMIRYRAASFFGRLNCPDMIMGIYSADEAIELDESQYRVIDPVEAVQSEITNHQASEEMDIEPEQEKTPAPVEEDAGTQMPETPTEPEPETDDSEPGPMPGF